MTEPLDYIIEVASWPTSETVEGVASDYDLDEIILLCRAYVAKDETQ